MIVRLGERTIGYDVRGEGPTVLLLHPFPFDRRFWANLALDGFRIVSMDARGFGESDARSDFTIDDLADDAVALLDHLGIPMAAAVGSSMGGYVALAIAARHEARLSALALVGTRAGADTETARENRKAAARQVRDHGAESFLDGTATRLCSRSASASVREEVEALARSSAPDLSRAIPPMLLALATRPDRTTLLPQLRVPALVVVGGEDAVTPPDEARATKRAIPGATLVELPGIGHLPSLEAPIEFAATLSTFLEATLAPSEHDLPTGAQAPRTQHREISPSETHDATRTFVRRRSRSVAHLVADDNFPGLGPSVLCPSSRAGVMARGRLGRLLRGGDS